MNYVGLQNSTFSWIIDSGRHLVTRGLVADSFVRVQGALRRYTDRHYREMEIARAIGHLQRLTDSQLRDMGITYDQIEQVVRHGKTETD